MSGDGAWGEYTSEILARALHDQLDGNHATRVRAITIFVDLAIENGFTFDEWMMKRGELSISMHGAKCVKRINEEIAKLETVTQPALFELKEKRNNYGE